MRDRLIELIKDIAYDFVANCGDKCDKCTHGDCVGKLVDHLLANGVIVLPCKVGDKLYVLSASKTKLYSVTITHFVVNEYETQIWGVGVPYASESAYICNADDLGNSEWVYFTREEAEKASERR